MARYTFVVFMLLTFLSCSNLTLEEDSLNIKSIQEGSQFSSGEIINVAIDNTGSSQPKTMNIEVVYIDSYSRNISDDFYLSDSIDLDEYPSAQFHIDETFPDGLYMLSIEVLDSDDSVIDSDEKEFSVFSGKIYNSVSSILPTNGVYTDSKVLLISDIDAHNIDPYIIWSHDSVVLGEGYLSEGYDSIVWNSSDNLGFNELKMEIYPFRFSNYIESEEFNIFSTVVSSIDMELFELDNYYRAFLFNGNLIDEMNKDIPVTLYGDFSPVAMDSFYGVELKSGNGFIAESSLIPLVDGELESYSLVVDLVYRDIGDNLIFKDERGELVSSLFSESGSLFYTQSVNSIEVGRVELNKIEIDKPEKVVLSHVVKDDNIMVYAYSGGEIAGKYTFSSVIPSSEISSFVLGNLEVNGESGESSFIIDSLMVYNRDNLGENNIYIDHFNNREGSIGLTGDGFYSLTKPEAVKGVWESNGETLTLEVGSILDLDYYIEGFNNFTLEMVLESTGNYTLLSIDDPDFSINLFGNLDIKKRGELYYVNGNLIDGVLTGLYIEAVDPVTLDEIRIISRESLEE